MGLVSGVMRCLLCGFFPLFCVVHALVVFSSFPLASRGPFFASLTLLLHSGFAIIPTVKELLHLRKAAELRGFLNDIGVFTPAGRVKAPLDRPSSGFCYLLSSSSAPLSPPLTSSLRLPFLAPMRHPISLLRLPCPLPMRQYSSFGPPALRLLVYPPPRPLSGDAPSFTPSIPRGSTVSGLPLTLGRPNTTPACGFVPHGPSSSHLGGLLKARILAWADQLRFYPDSTFVCMLLNIVDNGASLGTDGASNGYTFPRTVSIAGNRTSSARRRTGVTA